MVAKHTTIFERIHSALPAMSDAKRSVAEFLLENWQEAVFLSASRLARRSGVSESVVVRFSQDLGYTGFPDLQSALQKILQYRLTGFSGSEDENVEESPLLQGKHPSEAIQKVFDLTLKNLQNTHQSNSHDSYEQILNLIFDAHRIVVVSARNAFGPAKILATHLNEIFTNTNLINAVQDDLFDHLRPLSKNDLLITFGLPSYTRRTVQAAEFASERGIPLVAITDSLKSPLAQLSNVSLLTHFKSYSFASSHVATVFLIDVLVHLITVRDKGHVLKSIDELDNINHRFGLVDIEK